MDYTTEELAALVRDAKRYRVLRSEAYREPLFDFEYAIMIKFNVEWLQEDVEAQLDAEVDKIIAKGGV